MQLLQLLEKRDFKALESFLSECFAKNLNFFSRTSPALFETLKKESIDYSLVCNHKGVNLINLHNKSLLYPEMDGYYTMADLHRELAEAPLNNPRWNLHGNEIILSPLDERKMPLTGGAINKMIENLQVQPADRQFHLGQKFLPSSAIYGLFGGIFLEILRQSGVFFHALFIFEEHVDFFRISCYFVDYAALFDQVSAHALYLFVKEIIDERLLRQFFAARKVSANLMLLELQMYQSQKLNQARLLLRQEFSSNKRGWGSFEDEMIGICNALNNIHYKQLSYPLRVNAPICVVGNGPSLDALLPFIQKNADRMIIFSCGTALKPLKNYGIEPDFQIEIERIDYLCDVLKQAPLGDTTLLCGVMVNPSALRLAKEGYVFLRGGSSAGYLFDSSVIEYTAPFVGNAGAALAMQMGSEVLLCGMDCGYIEGKSKHAQGSFYGKEEQRIPENAIKIEGNKDLDVYADSIFLLSRQNLEAAIAIFKPKMVLNLGYGAKIKGARSIDERDFKLREIDKSSLLSRLKGYMKEVQAPLDSALIARAQEFVQALKNLLNPGVRDKKALFLRIDEVNEFLSRTSAKNPHLGILFEGSVAHLLQAMLLCALHLRSDAIFSLYQQNLEIMLWALDRMLFSYRLAMTFYLHGDRV